MRIYISDHAEDEDEPRRKGSVKSGTTFNESLRGEGPRRQWGRDDEANEHNMNRPERLDD